MTLFETWNMTMLFQMKFRCAILSMIDWLYSIFRNEHHSRLSSYSIKGKKHKDEVFNSYTSLMNHIHMKYVFQFQIVESNISDLSIRETELSTVVPIWVSMIINNSCIIESAYCAVITRISILHWKISLNKNSAESASGWADYIIIYHTNLPQIWLWLFISFTNPSKQIHYDMNKFQDYFYILLVRSQYSILHIHLYLDRVCFQVRILCIVYIDYSHLLGQSCQNIYNWYFRLNHLLRERAVIVFLFLWPWDSFFCSDSRPLRLEVIIK